VPQVWPDHRQPGQENYTRSRASKSSVNLDSKRQRLNASLCGYGVGNHSTSSSKKSTIADRSARWAPSLGDPLELEEEPAGGTPAFLFLSSSQETAATRNLVIS